MYLWHDCCAICHWNCRNINDVDMIKKYEIKEEAFTYFRHSSEEDIQKLRAKLANICPEFFWVYGISVYPSDSQYFLWCYKGLEKAYCLNSEVPSCHDLPTDTGYGLTFDSIAKYLKDNYGDNNPEEYFITWEPIPMDYEKIYKCGSYVNLDGENTWDDFYYVEPDFENLEKKADIKGNFIAFNVFHLKID